MDWDKFKKLATIHNRIGFGEATQQEFNDYVLEIADEIDEQGFEIFLENLELIDEYWNNSDNKEMLDKMYEIEKKMSHDKLGLRSAFRSAMFVTMYEDKFKKNE